MLLKSVAKVQKKSESATFLAGNFSKIEKKKESEAGKCVFGTLFPCNMVSVEGDKKSRFYPLSSIRSEAIDRTYLNLFNTCVRERLTSC